MADGRTCESCTYYRPGNPPDPFAGVKLVSKKTLELRSKWRQEMIARARVESQQLRSGEPFDYEPFAVPWCEHYSRPPEGAADGPRVYVPCQRQNPDADCGEHKPSAGEASDA